MKRTGIVLSLILIVSMLFSVCVYADGLSIVGTTPKDGATGKQPQNMAVKFKFSEKIADENLNDENAKYFEVRDAEGNAQPFIVATNEDKYPNELWVVMDGDLNENSEYTCTAKAGIKAVSGNVLEGDYTVRFKTRNTKTDSVISMVLMGVMMALMIFTSIRTAKKQQVEQAAEMSNKYAEEVKQLNPYKVAKEKNISLEDAQLLVSKEKAKLEKKQAKIDLERAKLEKAKAEEIAKFEAELRAAEEAARHADNYQVKRAHSITEAGIAVPKSVIKNNRRKKEAREKAAKEAERKALEKATKNKKKK